MQFMEFKANDGLVAKLARESEPVQAVGELVWNAVDAEASTVHVRLDRDEADAIIGVEVIDDGHGIGPDDVRVEFGQIGRSWKYWQERSKNGIRLVHGSEGEGRLRAFSLGSDVRWRSVAQDIAGQLQRVEIRGVSANKSGFEYEVEASLDGATVGTHFSAKSDGLARVQRLAHPETVTRLEAIFAPYLLDNSDVAIYFDGKKLDPATQVRKDRTVTLRVATLRGQQNITLRLIEWKSGKHRSFYYGSVRGRPTLEMSAKDIETDYAFSAYVTWPEFKEFGNLVTLGELAQPPVSDVTRSVNRSIREYFDARRRENRKSKIRAWQRSGAYPYPSTPPATRPQQVERALFDVVSGALSEKISRDKDRAKLTLTLLKDALQNNPDGLVTILHELVSLNKEDQDQLAKIVAETSLANVVRSASLVSGRNKFLLALESMIFDREWGSLINERDHLHKILERELWIFGEQYNLMASERGLTEILRRTLKLEGLPTTGMRPVKRADGSVARLDLHLAVARREHGRRRHLVIELKDPKITLGVKELNQVESYADTLLGDPQFAVPESEWDLVLVGSEIDRRARNRIHTGHLQTGKFFEPPERSDGQPIVRAYVRRWSEILEENRSRLEFFTTALEHDPSLADGIAHIQSTYGDILPKEFLQAFEQGAS